MPSISFSCHPPDKRNDDRISGEGVLFETSLRLVPEIFFFSLLFWPARDARLPDISFFLTGAAARADINCSPNRQKKKRDSLMIFTRPNQRKGEQGRNLP